MSDYRHQTDRKKATAVGGCSNGCQAFELETEGEDESVDELLETITETFDKCPKCGEPISALRSEEPVEELE